MKRLTTHFLVLVYFAVVYTACPISRHRGSSKSNNIDNIAYKNNQASSAFTGWTIASQRFDQPLTGIQFLDTRSGWAVSRNFLWRTQDGGDNWTKMAIGLKAPVIGTDKAGIFSRMRFLTETEGWLIEEGHLLHTTNAGKSWGKKEFPQTVLRSVHFVSARRGWAVGETIAGSDGKGTETWRGIILATSDGGENWKETPSHVKRDHNWSLFDVWGVDENQVYAVGDVILRSPDGGKTWRQLDLGQKIYGVPSNVQFNGSSLGWITTTQGNRFIITTNGGKSWEIKEAPSDVGGIYKLALLTPDNIWLVINDVLYSPDGGKTWTEQARGHFNDLFYSSSAKVMFAAGDVLLSKKVQ